MIKDELSYLGGYYNNSTYELDIPKIADVSELDEDVVERELEILQSSGDIDINGNIITLITIKPKLNNKFNNLYKPVETILWDKNSMLKLDC